MLCCGREFSFDNWQSRKTAGVGAPLPELAPCVSKGFEGEIKRPRLLLIIVLAMLAVATSCWFGNNAGTIDVLGPENNTVILQLANSPAVQNRMS